MELLYKKNVYAVSVISNFIIVISSFLSSILISRYLGPNLKGQYSYIFNLVGILSLVLNFGIGQSYTFFKKSMGEEIKQDFINIYFWQLSLYTFFIIIINIFYRSYVINIILFTSVLTQFNSQISFMAIVSNINRRNIISIYSVLFHSFFLIIIYFITDRNLNWVIMANILKTIFNTIYLIIQTKIVPSTIVINRKLLIKILKFSFFPMITSLLITFNYSIDVIILKQFVSYSDVGIYSVGVALAGMLWIVPDAFKDVLFNKTSKDDSIENIKFSIKFCVHFCFLVIIGFIALGRNFIAIFYGNEYLNAYNISILLLFGAIPMVFFKMINTLYISIGKQKFTFYILLLAVLGNITANYTLIPIMGIKGAAISSIISYLICGLLFLLSFMKNYNIAYKEIMLLNDLEKSKIVALLLRR